MKVKVNIKKKLDEDFYNPFDSDDKEKQNKPVSLYDKGGSLTPRKETFNLARVEYSKRPGGEFTVIAKTHFAKGEIVEICPTLILGEEVKIVDKIRDIVFEIDREEGTWALVLGYGSIYRHSEEANLEYAYNSLSRQMYFITKRPIKLNEELTINYGVDYWNERKVISTMADLEPRTDQNQGMPTKVPMEKNESEVQQNAADIQRKSEIRRMSSPANPHNPVRSGVAIIGGRG